MVMLITWFLSHLLLLCGFSLALPVIAQMVRQRRSPAGTLAWLLTMVLIPYVGIPLYLVLGGRKLHRLAASKEELKLSEQVQPLPDRIQEMNTLLRSYAIPGASTGNRLTLCHSGEEGYNTLVGLIEESHQSLWVSTFILHSDSVGRDIIDRLVQRANAGVKVYVLLDGVGSLHTGKVALAPLQEAGAKVAFFMPVLHRPFRGRTNLRNHRKAVIADACRVWAGGTNIATEYIGPTPSSERWKDLSFILEGPAVQHYQTIFRSDWLFATGESLSLEHKEVTIVDNLPGKGLLQVVPSGPDVSDDPLYAAILAAIFQAKKRLWIVTPYFIPDETLSQALQLAAHRGVDVRVVIPQKSNHWLADIARGTYLRDLQEAGGKILHYQPGMLHAKALLADDELALIGSANLDMRSLFLNYETGLLVYSPSEVQEIKNWINSLSNKCRGGVPNVGVWRDLSEGVARMLAPLL
jgi:cardiolipin synthase